MEGKVDEEEAFVADGLDARVLDAGEEQRKEAAHFAVHFSVGRIARHQDICHSQRREESDDEIAEGQVEDEQGRDVLARPATVVDDVIDEVAVASGSHHHAHTEQSDEHIPNSVNLEQIHKIGVIEDAD